MRTELVLDALEMAIWTRAQAGVADLAGLVHHSDAGNDGGLNRSSQHLDPVHRPARRSRRRPVRRLGRRRLRQRAGRGEIGLFKTELIRRRGPWRTLDDVEIATLEWVDWFNNRRLHTACADLTPAEFEAVHYRHHPALAETLVPT